MTISSNRMKIQPVVILLLFYYNCLAQHQKFIVPDSLAEKQYAYLSRGFLMNKNDTVKSLLYAQTWLTKSKKEKDAKQITLAYKALIHSAGKKMRKSYADSMLVAAKKTNDNALIGSSYLTRGIVAYSGLEQRKALDDFIMADEYVSKTNDQYLTYKVKYQIAQTKYYLGFYQEAISLLKECIRYFESENDRAYLNALHMLALCYNSTSNYILSTKTNNDGLRLAADYEIYEMTPYFTQSEGVNQYSKGNYTTAINLLSKSIPPIAKYHDFPNVMVSNFYIGKSYWALNEKENAVPFLKNVDKAFIQQNYIRPDLRSNYELLINFYKDHDDVKSQLFYINRLLKVDSILNTNYKYLSGKIFKQYDTKKLLGDKNDIQRSMKTQRALGSFIILLLSGIIAFLTYRHFKNRKHYSRKFDELMSQKPETAKPMINNSYIESELNLNPEVAEGILKNLEKFERNHKYLEKDMNLVKLATILSTNQKYVTKIIAHYRGKKTIEYVSDLKITYIVTMLKTQSKFRNYTNKALGEEAGFGSTQIFTKAFKTVTGMPPTFFINEIKKAAPTHN